MRRFLLPPDFTGGRTCTLGAKDSHYLIRVLRLGPGALVPGRDRSGRMWDLIIAEADPKAAVLSCTPSGDPVTERSSVSSPAPEGKPPAVPLHLFQSLCKGKKMDSIIRQATEVGAVAVTPITTRFTIAGHGRQGIPEGKSGRWQTIVREAIQQSGSPVVTRIEEPLPFSRMLEEVRGMFGICFHHERLSHTGLGSLTAEYLHTCREQGKILTLALIIGPEGGFAPEEVDAMRSAGIRPVFLETNILRAETAALYALAAVQTLAAHQFLENPDCIQ